jgi:hypothetical protein
MVDWALTDEGKAGLTELPTFVRREVDVPADSWHMILQWKSGTDTPEKMDVVSCLATSLDSRAVLYRRGAPPSSKAATDQFVKSIDGDDWWLGDIALLLANSVENLLLIPTVDGAFLDFYGWGATAEDLKTRLVRSLSRLVPPF